MKLATQFLCAYAVTLLLVHRIDGAPDKELVSYYDPTCAGKFHTTGDEKKVDLKTSTVVNKKYKIANLSEMCTCSFTLQYDKVTEKIDYLKCEYEVNDDIHLAELDKSTMLIVDKGSPEDGY